MLNNTSVLEILFDIYVHTTDPKLILLVSQFNYHLNLKVSITLAWFTSRESAGSVEETEKENFV